MEINTNNSSGMLNGLPPMKKEDRKVGPIVGALIVIFIIIMITLYFFGKRLNTNDLIINTPPVQNNISTTSSSTSSTTDASIEAELETILEDVDYSF
jgi:hypothetical protein